jgi:hypothetical protein
MAKRKAGRGGQKARTGRKPAAPRRAARRPKPKIRAKSKVKAKTSPKRGPSPKAREAAKPAGKQARIDRVRKTLTEGVPSSLNLDRHGSAARTGRAEIAESQRDHQTMTPSITGGDVDADVENAYFSGDEAPGGDNPTPDQDIVDDIGRAIGLEYQDSEELDADKVVERDKHRWELDPASSEDYKDRK